MKFRGLRPPTNEDDVPKFVITELVSVINDLIHGLKKLTLGDNFESFEVKVDIAAGAVATISNPLPFIPSRYIILGNSAGVPIGEAQDTGANTINVWTEHSVKLKNYGAFDTTVKVIFMR